jgi:uncharacterized membrane protein HdeD (DUF308 family)
MASSWRTQATALSVQGGLLILLGFVSILLPVISTLALAIVLGAVLVVAGVSEGIRAIRAWGRPGAISTLLIAVVAVIAGILTLFNPFSGAVSLAIVIGVYMIVAGLIKARLAWALRPFSGWSWMAFSAALSIVLGVVVIAGLPTTALWVPGTLLGVELVFFGMALFMLAGALRKTI